MDGPGPGGVVAGGPGVDGVGPGGPGPDAVRADGPGAGEVRAVGGAWNGEQVVGMAVMAWFRGHGDPLGAVSARKARPRGVGPGGVRPA